MLLRSQLDAMEVAWPARSPACGQSSRNGSDRDRIRVSDQGLRAGTRDGGSRANINAGAVAGSSAAVGILLKLFFRTTQPALAGSSCKPSANERDETARILRTVADRE